MANLRVDRSGKDRDGDINALCGDWGRHPKQDAVRNIRGGVHTYYTSVGGRQAVVQVRQRNGKDYLTTAADGYSPNNLDNLPNC